MENRQSRCRVKEKGETLAESKEGRKRLKRERSHLKIELKQDNLVATGEECRRTISAVQC